MEQLLREIAGRLHESGDRVLAHRELLAELERSKYNVEGATLTALDKLRGWWETTDSCVDQLIHAADVEGAAACGCAL